MRCDQIAFYASAVADAEKIKAQFGLTNSEWIKDTVTANSNINGGAPEINVAELQFNYDLGIELEILRYIEGPNWHQSNPLLVPVMKDRRWQVPPFVSHVGIHLEDDEEFPAMEHCKLVQETFTKSHTSDYLINPNSKGFGRLYHYRIFEMSPGSYVKYIKRIHP